MLTVVVLPFVPVTPTIDNSFAGQPYAADAAIAAARRVSFTTSAGSSVREESRTIPTEAPALAAALR